MVLKACSLLKETDDHKGDTSVVTPEGVARDLCGKWDFFFSEPSATYNEGLLLPLAGCDLSPRYPVS